MPGNLRQSRAWADRFAARSPGRAVAAGIPELAGFVRPWAVLQRGSAHEPPPENRPNESRGVRRRAALPGERYRHPP
jgi:hypothetical protein